MEKAKQVISWILGLIAVLAVFGALWAFLWLGWAVGLPM